MEFGVACSFGYFSPALCPLSEALQEPEDRVRDELTIRVQPPKKIGPVHPFADWRSLELGLKRRKLSISCISSYRRFGCRLARMRSISLRSAS